MRTGISNLDIDLLASQVQERIKLLPNLKTTTAGLDDQAVALFAKDALLQAQKDGFSDNNIVMGASYLTAHFCLVASATNTNVAKQQASVLTIEYFDRAGIDDYLLEYQRLKNSLQTSKISFM